MARRSRDAGGRGLPGASWPARLAAAGFAVESLRFGGVDNLWARRGTGGPVFCFAGHTDVVPTGPLEEWQSDPFVPAIRDGVAVRARRGRHEERPGGHGDGRRGVRRRPTRHHKGSIAFLITSDEEGPSVDGTKRVVQTLRERGERIDWCVVGEPSSESVASVTPIKVGRRGSFSGRLTVHGVQGHVAYPQLAENPVHTLAPALAELTSRVVGPGHGALPADQLPGLQPQRRHRRAERHPRGAARRASTCATRPVQTLEGLKETVEEILHRHGVRYTLEWYVSGRAVLHAAGRAVARRSARRCAAGDGRAAEALHRRRHVGRALHRAARARRWWSSAW